MGGLGHDAHLEVLRQERLDAVDDLRVRAGDARTQKGASEARHAQRCREWSGVEGMEKAARGVALG